ncbi:MAG: transcriptional regulator [Candidatus Nomurabacteria bacterium GW2011_GWA2_40_9]|uniref:Transcriptional regulator n=1 Tax=Candidatus Nomurabacteria bacterium GW2011_GWA2_40_9 TaxID=1618734 RepID=A0A0G0WWF6_9BACT|nr:MAG: transcriptional regulator [Candidatus Nomurabacteria bacterium GW2011_GWA2_40_9]
MSGHNKWSQIKNKKAITDAKKSKIFSKLVKFIAVEARLSGGKDSPGLRSAIEKAKKVNMPKDIIERAVKKASDSNVTMENIMYESYGPGGVGVIIETLTDSRNRTAQDVKHILAENGTTFAGIGSVAWAFKKEISPEGLVWTPTSTVEATDEDLELLEKLVDDLENNDDVQDVFTNAE